MPSREPSTSPRTVSSRGASGGVAIPALYRTRHGRVNVLAASATRARDPEPEPGETGAEVERCVREENRGREERALGSAASDHQVVERIHRPGGGESECCIAHPARLEVD